MDCAHAVAELRLILSNALLLPPFSAQGRQSLFALKPCPSLHRLRERMSRRKQDNPMQLKRTLTGSAADEDMDPDPLEADEAPPHDLIQCGDCHTNFALADIVKFIAHKRICYKRQQVVVSSNEIHTEEEEEEQEDGNTENHAADEIISMNTTIHANEPIVRTQKPKIITPFRRKSQYDQGCEVCPVAKETQTEQLPEEIAHEPLICSTCKVSFYSAAELLHHVQIDHGLHIYQQDAKENHATEIGGPLKEMLQEREDDKEATMAERTPNGHNPRERGDDPSNDEKEDDKNLNEPDTADSHVVSSHPQEQAQMTPSSQHMPLLSTGNSPLPIYIRHPLGGDRYPGGGDTGRYFPVPLGQPYPIDFGMPLNHQPSEATHGMNPHYDSGASHIPFSTATQHASQVDESAAQRLRLIADGASPCEQLSFQYQRPYRPSLPPKLKSCEFCGKPFKFQSNLIVHRRSHTGEKPYKCSLCDHACSQASKLKRHMKTHKSTRSLSDDSERSRSRESHNGKDSNNSTDSKPGEDDYASSDKHSSSNSSIDEEEEEQEREEREQEEREMEEDEMQPNQTEEPPPPPPKERSRSTSSSSNQASLLSEVMKRTGLSEIQQYKDAYQQAVAEQHNYITSAVAGYCSARHSNFLSNKKEANGPLLSGSSKHPLRGSPSPIRHLAPLPSPIRNSLPLPTNLPPHPFNDSSPPPLESDRDPSAKRFKPEPPSPPSIRTPPRATAIWPSLTPQSFFTPILNLNSSMHHHPGSVMPGPIPNGSLSMLSSSHHRRFYPARSGEPPIAPSVLPTFHNPNQRRSRSITNRRSDECEFCGKVFKNCSNLTVHRRSHTGEKPYKCELCAYACAQSSKLTRHMKTHGRGAKEVFKCEVCGMPFSVYSTLEKHMKKEHWGSIKGPAPRPETSCTGRGHSYKPLPK